METGKRRPRAKAGHGRVPVPLAIVNRTASTACAGQDFV